MGTNHTTMYRLAAVCATVIASVSSFPFPQGGPPAGPLPIPREGQYGPDNYFQYINVPAHKTFEWGYRRGNPKHNREEYLSQKDHTFKAKLKWHDDYGGHGEHYFDYNHVGPKHDKHAPSYGGPHGLHSENLETRVEPESPPAAFRV